MRFSRALRSDFSSRITRLFFSILFLCRIDATAQTPFPGDTWLQYASVEDAGWSLSGIEAAKTYADSIGTAAFMLVHNGIVVTTYGDIDRRYMCHSVRKSLLSGLYGVHVGLENIDVSKTLADLGIDDKDALTDEEKQATILDMLKARSGVYHPAAYETAGMKRIRPARGSHRPGTFWYYNNWDFNTLGVIFERETGKKIFEEFKVRFADPLQMQDYRVRDGYYHLEAHHSNFPAYPFRLSARDMARFGLLYLNEGNWNGEQIIPTSWVRESTKSYSNARGDDGYGYMWWVLGGEPKKYGTYSAYGVGTQTITVLPELNLVFVHRVNTFVGERVRTSKILKLLEMLIEAHTGKGHAHPETIALVDSEDRPVANLDGDQLGKYAGSYIYESGQQVRIGLEGDRLIVDTGFGYFDLLPLSKTEFLVEDAEERVYFASSSNNGRFEFISERILNREGYFFLQQGKVVKAIEIFKRNTEYFPESFNVYDSLAEAYMANGENELAIRYYKRSLEINPGNTNGIEMLKRLTDH